MNITPIIVKLKQSPLFYLFSSSRELFHTNFWYWLSTIDPYQTAILFDATIPVNSKIEFHREYKKEFNKVKAKVDLVIEVNGKIHTVIENKVKDFPHEAQLQRTIMSFGPLMPNYVLVSLFTPTTAYPNWLTIGYAQLAAKIDENAFSGISKYYRELIRDYKHFILHLSQLATQLVTSTDYDFAISNIKDLYNALNGVLWEGYLKMRGNDLVSNYSITANSYGIVPSYHINNQKSTLHFPIELGNGYRIGVQIEDHEFRKFVSGEKHLAFAQAMLNSALFFSSKKEDRDNRAIFRKYNPDFSFQYKKLPGVVPQSELFNKINEVLKYVHDNLNAIKQLVPP